VRDYHRLLISQKYNSSDPDTEDDNLKSAVSLTLSPSRISVKCPHCLIGRAEPPEERVKRQVTDKSVCMCKKAVVGFLKCM